MKTAFSAKTVVFIRFYLKTEKKLPRSAEADRGIAVCLGSGSVVAGYDFAIT